ncbi:hypothetical protein BBI01_01400 [Chryseobacterium artocarpi]|uniref:Outer membrane protein beta-barrel domain-containing protein n=1 Tax=Chryseobacterium artocarpi TaxID=1414727 RepID=A0A1B8ZZW5_9FLAO|nr:hypothetical protein [Chryseobacterium artocarpi]OCA77146.1 hypothetical protein BBI01_01400 [Chryseobacterium artocarpi]
MMKVIILFVLGLFVSSASIAQGQKYAFVEAGGSSIFAAVNFDMRFKKDAREGLGFRAGVGNTFGVFDSELVKDVVVFPVGLNYVYGSKRSSVVVGFNTSIVLVKHRNGSESPVIISPEIGYRYRPYEKGIAFHASYVPLFNTADGTMPVWLGVGVGYSW